MGRFDGDILSLAHGGPGMHVRMTYDLSDPENLRTRMEMSQDGADWNTLFDGSYKQIWGLNAVHFDHAARDRSFRER